MDTLSQLADKYKTDKGLWHHSYTPIYHSYFEKLRNDNLTLLEIGIGGYEYPDKGGESLRMWADYFPNAKIVGIDIHEKTIPLPDNVMIAKGSQIDMLFLSDIIQSIGNPDIIIDDGSHINEHIIQSFRWLFPNLKSGGVYVVEDTETSYWEDYGDGIPPNLPTTMNYFKKLADTLNSPIFPLLNDFNIKSIHFYKGLIFIFKL